MSYSFCWPLIFLFDKLLILLLVLYFVLLLMIICKLHTPFEWSDPIYIYKLLFNLPFIIFNIFPFFLNYIFHLLLHFPIDNSVIINFHMLIRSKCHKLFFYLFNFLIYFTQINHLSIIFLL